MSLQRSILFAMTSAALLAGMPGPAAIAAPIEPSALEAAATPAATTNTYTRKYTWTNTHLPQSGSSCTGCTLKHDVATTETVPFSLSTWIDLDLKYKSKADKTTYNVTVGALENGSYSQFMCNHFFTLPATNGVTQSVKKRILCKGLINPQAGEKMFVATTYSDPVNSAGLDVTVVSLTVQLDFTNVTSPDPGKRP